MSFDSFTMQMLKTYCHSIPPSIPVLLSLLHFGWGGVVLGFCGGWWCVFSFWTLEDLCMSPKGFTAMRSCNLICLVWIQAIKKKGVNLYLRWILWNSLLQDVSDARNAQRDWIYLWVSHTFMVATACAKSEYKNWGEYPLMLQSLSPTLN